MTDLSTTTAEELAETVERAFRPGDDYLNAILIPGRSALAELARRASALEAVENALGKESQRCELAEGRLEAAEKELAERNESYNRQGRKYTRASLRAEAAEARVEELETALRPFATRGSGPDRAPHDPGWETEGQYAVWITRRELGVARAALAASPPLPADKDSE